MSNKLLKLSQNYLTLTKLSGGESLKLTFGQLQDVLDYLSEKMNEYSEDDIPPTLLKQYKHVEHMIEAYLSNLMMN